MNSYEAKECFLRVLKGESEQSGVPGWIPRNCFSFELDGKPFDSAALPVQQTGSTLVYEPAPGNFPDPTWRSCAFFAVLRSSFVNFVKK